MASMGWADMEMIELVSRAGTTATHGHCGLEMDWAWIMRVQTKIFRWTRIQNMSERTCGVE